MQTLEVVLVLPILLILFLASLQFGILMVVQQAVGHAATVGAREAGKGADVDEVACVVNQMLSPHALTVPSNASVTLEDPDATPGIRRRGTLTCDPPPGPSLDSDEVRVTVCVDATGKPFLNPLRHFGVCVIRRLKASSVVKKQSSGGP
jgi:Flp pilus assembly protein TadG